MSDLTQAQGDSAKAQLELQKGPILAEIAKLENEVKAEIARQHVDSLTSPTSIMTSPTPRRCGFWSCSATGRR